MQRRPPISTATLPIAIFFKLFTSLVLTIILGVSLVFAISTPDLSNRPTRTPKPTQTKVIKTPFTLFGFIQPKATPIATNTKLPAPSPTMIPTEITISEVQPTQVVENTAIPQIEQPVIQPTEIPAPTSPPAATVTTVQGGIQLPAEPFRADNLAYIRLIGQMGKGRINQVLWADGNSTANLFAATTGGFFFMDTAVGSETGSVFLPTAIISTAISPDGKYLVTSGQDNSVTIWQYGTNQIVSRIDTQGLLISVVTFSPDGSSIAGAGQDGNIYYWNLSDGGLTKVFEGTGSPVRAMQISPDGQMIIAGNEDKTISMWNVASGIRFISLTAHYKPVNNLIISPDSKIVASSSDDNTFILWDTTNGKQIRLTSVDSGVRSIAFTRDGTGIISGELEGTVKFWDVATGNLIKTIGKVPGEVNSLAFNADSSILAIGADTLHLWNSIDDSLSAPFRGFTYSTTSLAINPESSLIAAGGQDGRITLWNPQTGEQTAQLEGHTGNVTALSFSPDGRMLASGGADNGIVIWDVASGQKIYVLRGHSGGIRSLTFNSDGTRLASAGGWVDITLKMWDMTTGQGLFNITGFSKGDLELAVRRGSNDLASGGGDGIIRVWDFDSRELISTMEKHSRAIRSINFSPDGSQMASSSEDGFTYLWETTNWSLINSLQTKGSNSLVYSIDNLVLAVAGEGIEFWDTNTGNLLTEFAGTPGTQTKLAASLDGKILAAGSTDGTIRLFGVAR